MALKAYREFLFVWPNLEYAIQAESAVERIETQIAEMLIALNLSEDEFELLVLHDEILFELSANRTEGAIVKARKLLAIKPGLVSARINMILALFQLGKIAKAVLSCLETLELFLTIALPKHRWDAL